MPKTEDALKNLKAAYKILKDEENWITGGLAVDSQGESCLPTEKNAVKFCALGAVQHVDGHGEKLAINLLVKAAGNIRVQREDCDENGIFYCEDDIFTVNDEMGYEPTLEMFQEAIKLAKSKLKKVTKKAKKGKK